MSESIAKEEGKKAQVMRRSEEREKEQKKSYVAR